MSLTITHPKAQTRCQWQKNLLSVIISIQTQSTGSRLTPDKLFTDATMPFAVLPSELSGAVTMMVTASTTAPAARTEIE